MVDNQWNADAVLHPGPFPEGHSKEVEDLWMAISTLETTVFGAAASAISAGPVVSSSDLDQLRRLSARLAVVVALAHGGKVTGSPAA